MQLFNSSRPLPAYGDCEENRPYSVCGKADEREIGGGADEKDSGDYGGYVCCYIIMAAKHRAKSEGNGCSALVALHVLSCRGSEGFNDRIHDVIRNADNYQVSSSSSSK